MTSIHESYVERQRFAMAWDEWSDQIEHVYDGYPKNKYIYQINHGPHPDYPQWPRTSFVSYWDGGRMGFSPGHLSIDLLQVHDDFQKKGVAEALMRKMHQDHPNHKIIPGEMSDKGQGFHDRMLQKEPTARELVTAANRLLMATADFNPREVTERLGNEFRDWADQNKEILHPTHPYLPQRDWKNVERFLKENYPAAHKGFSTGLEQAGLALDRPVKGRRYQTGPKTMEALGYDPKEVAAGMLLLHNRSHPFRMDQSSDVDRLVKIFDKRQQMQRNYEQRQDNSVKTAMAWQDWSKQIQDQKDEGWDTPLGNYQSYNIDHGAPDWWGASSEDWQGSRGSGVSYYVDHDDKNIKIDYLSTHPEFRNRGVAEALMRRIHEDHPGYSIRPGEMSDSGQAFHNRMLEKEPAAKDLVTARMLLAMAWDEWAPEIKEDLFYEGNTCSNGCYHGSAEYGDRPGGFGYWIDHGNDDKSKMTYYHRIDKDNTPSLQIGMLETNRNYRHDGVAEAFLRKLNEDHPGMRIDPGYMTNEGQAFHDKMLQKEPAARDLVTGDMSMYANQ